MNYDKHLVTFGTHDLGQASALICRGFEIIDLAPTPDSERVTFYFEPNDKLESSARDYWSGKLMVDAKQFSQEMKNLKARLYSQRTI